MKIKNKLHLILSALLLSLFIVPANVFAYSSYVISGGNILEVNNNKVNDINSMVNLIEKNVDNNISFKVLRNGKEKNVTMGLLKDSNGVLKTRLYVKDKINGIGTLTYIDPESKVFGALGHEIIESSTVSRFEIKDGKIYEGTVSGFVKSRNGKAGEKNATYDKNDVYGVVTENEIAGIFGKYSKDISMMDTIEVGKINDITTGDATIRTVIDSNNVEDFDINIINIDTKNKTKNILFEITDKRLLETTGGIVQGMSGSPIIQNNKIIGAVNYVIVNDTTKGYGIFITTMLEEGDK